MPTTKLDEVAQDLTYPNTENLSDCTNPLGHSCVVFTTPMEKIFSYIKLKFPLLQMMTLPLVLLPCTVFSIIQP